MKKEFVIKSDPRRPEMWSVSVSWRGMNVNLGSFETFDLAFQSCNQSKKLFEGIDGHKENKAGALPLPTAANQEGAVGASP